MTPLILLALGSLTMLGPLGTDTFLPAIPVMREDLDATASAIQLTLTAFTDMMGAGQLFAGPLSDRFGRKRPMMAGTALFAIGGVVAALAPTVPVLVGACALMGLGGAASVVVARAVAADLTTPQEAIRSFTILGALTTLGPVVGPLLGVVLLTLFGWRGIFAGLALLGLAILITTLRTVPETLAPELRVPRNAGELAGVVIDVLRTRSFLTSAAVAWFGFGLMFAYISASPFVVQTVLGESAATYSVIFAANGAGMILVAALTARIAHRFAARALMAAGVTLLSVGAVAMLGLVLADAVTMWTALPAMFLMIAPMGLVFGPSTALAISELRHVAGTALAVYGAVQFLTAGAVAPLVGLAGETSALPFAVVALGCAVLAAITLLVGGRRVGAGAVAAS